MRRLVHALVFVVALVLPLQGMTAVAAGQCMALGHHGDGLHSAHDHGVNADAQDGTVAHHADNGAGEGSSKVHCPPCVSCCAAPAIASFPVSLMADQPGSWVVPALPVFFSGVPPESLDRPPLAL